MSDPQRNLENPQHGRGPMVVRLGPVRSAQELIQPVQPPSLPKTPRRRKSRLVSMTSALLTVLAVGGVVGFGGSIIVEREFQAPGPLKADKVVVIQKNSGIEDIADVLSREGVIDQPALFMLKAQLQKLGSGKKHLRAGEYQFKQEASLNAVVDTLTSGQAIMHAVTIPEGLTSQQIVDKLREYDFLTGDIAETPIEGALLPTTLKYERGTSRQTVIDQLRSYGQSTLKDVWAKRSKDTPLTSPQEMVVLASIVEKETSRADERPRIAAVFFNRLARNMRLQSDPTTIYGLVGGKGTLGRPLTRADLETRTAYNTYVINGLPPGPIANPGRAALEAVANPSRTKELYFVADGSGGHAFAETLDQHNRNVQRWRQLQTQKDQSSPGDAPAQDAPPAPAAKPDQKTEWRLSPPHSLAAVGAAPRALPSGRMAMPPSVSAYAMPSLQITRLDDMLGTADNAPVDDFAAEPAQASDDSAGQVQSWPISPAMKARIHQGVEGGNSAIAAAEPEFESEPAQATARPVLAAGQHPRAFDAVAGTKLDPLRNRSYDLTSAKTVPVLR
jgi:UPF0755 protein